MIVRTARKSDHVSLIIAIKWLGVLISWATQRNDPWRTDDEREVRIGTFKRTGEYADGRAFIIGRLSVTFASHKR